MFSPYTSITTNILFFDQTGPTEETWFYRLDMPESYKHFSKTKPMKLEHFAAGAGRGGMTARRLPRTALIRQRNLLSGSLPRNWAIILDQCGYPHEEEEILAPLDLIHRYEEQRASLNAEIDRVLFEIQSVLGKG